MQCMKGFGQKSIFCGCEQLKNGQKWPYLAILSCSHPQNIDFCPKPFIHCILYHRIYHVYNIYDIKLIFDEENQDFWFWRLFLWSFIVFTKEITVKFKAKVHKVAVPQNSWKKSGFVFMPKGTRISMCNLIRRLLCFLGHPSHHVVGIIRNHRDFVKEVYISCPNWWRSLLMPLGSIVWRRHIQRSSWCSRSASVLSPVCSMEISMSFSGSWSLKKCCASAQLPGLLRQSYKIKTREN